MTSEVNDKMIHLALLVVFSVPGTLGVSTTGRYYDRQKETRAFATRTNLIEMKQPRCGTMPMECLLQCNRLPACPALNAFSNGTCELLLSPVLDVHFLAESTAYIHRFEPADTTDLIPATTSMPAVPPVTSQPKEATPTDETCPADFGHTFHTSTRSYCYKFVVNQKRSWEDARAHCVSLGGNLVAIETRAELNHLSKVVGSYNSLLDPWFWSSGTDKDVEGEWRWESTGALVDDSLPSYYDVSHGNRKNCLSLSWFTTSSDWRDGDCTSSVYQLCEVSLG